MCLGSMRKGLIFLLWMLLDAVRSACGRTAICNATLTFSLFYNVIGWFLLRFHSLSNLCCGKEGSSVTSQNMQYLEEFKKKLKKIIGYSRPHNRCIVLVQHATFICFHKFVLGGGAKLKQSLLF